MTFISYARNFEDVMLWRALGSAGPGFYIDVGAGHPDDGSVTRALYDRGWSGVNAEADAELARRLRTGRPRDVTLQVELDGHEPDTLAELCRRHAAGTIHLLRVAAAGAPRAVLDGGDFLTFRPWIVLVQATGSDPAWDGNSYRSVWFDGLNRFYVAEERAAALASHFHVPPNLSDDFIRVADTEWAARIALAEARRDAAELAARLAGERADRLSLQLAESAAEMAELSREGGRALRAQERRLHELTGLLAATRGSTSWRITAPLRYARILGRSLRRRAGAHSPVAPEPSTGATLAGPVLGMGRPSAEPLRVAWVSPWRMHCGIAEYSRHLIAHLPATLRAGLVVLGDDRLPDRADPAQDGPPSRRAWAPGDPGGVDQLVAALAAEDPDIVVLQHQPGLIPWPVLVRLLRHPGMASRTPVVTLHNTRHLLEIGEPDRAAVIDALGGIGRVLVHTRADLDRLKHLGLVANVTILPHGTFAPRPLRPARSLTHEDAPLIGCYGFLLPDKGVPQLIEAFARLRRRWMRARLRLVTACYPTPDGDAALADCLAAIAAAGLGDAVELIADFLPHQRSIDLVADCDLVVLPYQSSLEASSAAVRTVLSAGTPVAVTPLPLFDEAEDSVVRLAGLDPASIADGIDALLDDAARRGAAGAAAQGWMTARSWDGIACRLAGLLRHLVQART